MMRMRVFLLGCSPSCGIPVASHREIRELAYEHNMMMCSTEFLIINHNREIL